MNTVKFPNRELIEQQAADWVAAIDRGITNKQQKSLHKWLEQSPLHGESLVRLASMWDLLDVLSPIAKLLPIEEGSHASRATTSEHYDSPTTESQVAIKSFSIKPFAVAAGLGLLAISLLFNNNILQGTSAEQTTFAKIQTQQIEPILSTQTYVTAVGERSNITLDDGSEIKLNTDSKIVVQFSQDQRRLQLVKGEAFFAVAKNPNRPFVVLTDTSRITAVGTAFSIDISSANDTEVLVIEGRVKVDRLSSAVVSAKSELKTAGTEQESPVYLNKGQQVLLNYHAAKVSYKHDIDAALAWREGKIIFTGESLAVAVREIDRYIPLDFEIVDPQIASIPVGGFFKTGDLDQLLLIFEQNFGVVSERKGNRILLSRAK